jgi:succinate dehydrogenase / fumarate reductase iron-sulfur subunit
VLVRLKSVDESISLRRSCYKGICGQDAININGANRLACQINMKELPSQIILRLLPGLPMIRDLIVDMTSFFQQYHSVIPYLINDTLPPGHERLQSPEAQLDGLYECIPHECCSSACPSFWWNPGKYGGPAGLLRAYLFIVVSRDMATSAPPSTIWRTRVVCFVAALC